MPSTAPVIPPRPSRSPHHGLSTPPSSDIPKIPPRPTNRQLERSVSPSRGSFAPSPLNEIPGRPQSRHDSSSNVPSRPPSVTLPSLGQEGMEYEDLDYTNASGSQSQGRDPPLEQKRDIGSDVKLHAPRPSLPFSTARAKVHAVTHTNSQQAAAAGFGKVTTPAQDVPDRSSRPIQSETNGSRTASTAPSMERRSSIQLGDEHGIPEIGQQVPMYPNAGDVQAPSAPPNPSATAPPGSRGGSQRPGRQHQRTRSGRELSLPPGSYGLHGHGVQSNDKFEKAWYSKHPDELAREERGQYGPGLAGSRAESALSSDDLNRIVRSSAGKGTGLGASSAVTGTPEEELGYIASEEFTSRLNSPTPASRAYHEKRQSNHSQPAIESPLHRTSFPTSETAMRGEEGTSTDAAVDNEDPDVIHVDEPYHHQHHPDGFAPAKEDGHHAHAQGDWDHEADDEAPVLASDEVDPSSEHMQPAISPSFERRDGYFGHEHEARSASSSRPVSTHAAIPATGRFNSRGEEIEEMHTPLDDVEEYEPLFPEDGSKDVQPLSAADRFKQRPDFPKHRFPSQDVWEDTPNSLQLHTTVSTPDVTEEGLHSSYESPNREAARKEETQKADTDKLAAQIQESKSHLDDETRQKPEARQRFPSKDVWEDAPESHQLVTTVQTPEPGESGSPVDVKPAIPPRPTISKAGEQSQDKTTGPSIPSRPQKRVLKVPPFDPHAPTPSRPTVSPIESRKVPSLPDRPKPQMPARPARPAKPIARDSSDSLTKTNSGSSTKSGDISKDAASAPIQKAKPAVPTKPGSKIAALKAGFLSDLDKRLQLGPMGPKPPEKKEELEEPAEKVPLSDARKGRARGPARRKPAVTTAPKAEPAPARPAIPEIKITDTWNVWQVNENGALIVGSGETAKKASTPEASPSPVTSTKDAASDLVEPKLEAAETEASHTKDSPVGDVVQESEVTKPTNDASTADDLKSSPVAPEVDNPPPSSKVVHPEKEESDEDVGKEEDEEEEEEAKPQSLEEANDPIDPEKPSSPVPATSTEEPKEEDLTDKDLEEMTASADGKRVSDGTLKFES